MTTGNRTTACRLLIGALVLLCGTFGTVYPQGSGGKAEPLRVEFRRGASSATVRGAVRDSEEAEYVVAARAGQKLTIRLVSTPPGSTVPRVQDPDMGAVELAEEGAGVWSVILPKAGDYQITVVRARSRPGRSQYALTLTIRNRQA